MKNEVPILEYHDLSERPHKVRDFHSPYILLNTKFYKQMEWLSKNGYRALTIDDLLRNNISEKAVVLTFDDGHISNYKLAFPILMNFNFVATFFVIPEFLSQKGYITRQQILEMYEQGMKFESHSLTHPYLLSLTKEEIILELRKSKEKIEEIINSDINHFSVPYGFYNKYLVRCVNNAGYKSLVTEDFGYYKPKKDSFHVLPRFTVKSQTELSKFTNIVEKRKLKLINDYLEALFIQNFKRILGFKVYIRLKSLALKASI